MLRGMKTLAFLRVPIFFLISGLACLGSLHAQTTPLDLTSLIDAYQRAIKIEPNDAKAWYNLGTAYGNAGRSADEIAAYQQAIKIKPDFAKAWYNLGVAYGKAGRAADEIAAYQQAIKIKPD